MCVWSTWVRWQEPTEHRRVYEVQQFDVGHSNEWLLHHIRCQYVRFEVDDTFLGKGREDVHAQLILFLSRNAWEYRYRKSRVWGTVVWQSIRKAAPNTHDVSLK